MTRGRYKGAIVATMACALATGAGAVGLGPLVKSGIIDGPKEAFYLTLYNPYETSADFIAYSTALDSDATQDRVEIFPAETMLAGHTSRQILVIASDLVVDQTYSFRVCAERKTPPTGITINARVCSKISARRIG